MYSIVKRATILVSRPNQTLEDMECTAGTVSRTVMIADKIMRKVLNI
jgi:hypothetical protein